MKKYRRELTGGEAGIACLLMLAFVVIATALSALVFQFLWNIVVPALFGGPTLDYPVAVAVVLLLGMLRSLLR